MINFFLNFIKTKNKPMKKIILLLAIITTCLFTNAQNDAKTNQPDAATKAKSMTAKMTKELTLTTDQQTKVMSINLERTTAMEANRTKSGNDKTVFEQEKKRINDKWNKDLAVVLTADQMAKLKQMEADQKAKNAGAKPQ
jgi:protein CpxP